MQTTEYKMSANEVQQMQKCLEDIQKQFQSFAETQDQMLFTLTGNPLDKNDSGMIGKLKSVIEDVEIIKEDRKKLKWTFGGFMIAGSILFGIVELAIKSFFK